MERYRRLGGLCRKNDAGKRLQNSDEMWLMYYKWNLRTTCNAILDFSVHANNMSKEQALHLLVGSFPTASGSGWKMESSYLIASPLCSYFTGYTEIYDFRDLKKGREDLT
jgi:hypothetical protein